MKEIIKIRDSGIWAIVFAIFWMTVVIGSGLESIEHAIDRQGTGIDKLTTIIENK